MENIFYWSVQIINIYMQKVQMNTGHFLLYDWDDDPDGLAKKFWAWMIESG